MSDSLINALHILGQDIQNFDHDYQNMAEQAHRENAWFTPRETQRSLSAIANQFLDEEKLRKWLSHYKVEGSEPVKVGMIFAGNLPAVGFHDLLCGLVSPHQIQVKLSHKDRTIIPFLLRRLESVANIFLGDKVTFVDRLEQYDAVIATGGEQAADIFREYFKHVPHIIRGHRNSVAVLDGNETDETLTRLSHDVFDYFGMGCRNVSKIFVPKDYDWRPILGLWEKSHDWLADHHKYRNNYDYNMSLFLLNKKPHLLSSNLVVVREESLHSRLASVNTEEYEDVQDVVDFCRHKSDAIQCVISEMSLPELEVLAPGQAQNPGLDDYADGVDTMSFLSQLNHAKNQ